MSGSTWADQPEQRTYRAACSVNLRLRFDETLQIAVDRVADAVGRDRTDAGQIAQAPDDMFVALRAQQRASRWGTRQSEIVPVSATHGLEPLVMPSDPLTVVANRQPISATVNESGIRKAGEFELEFLYRDLPIDHKVVRACGVEVHMGVIPADEYARGLAGERDEDGRLLSTLKTTTGKLDQITGRPVADLGTLVLYGAVDVWTNDDDRDDGARVRVKGRDLRGIFLDAKVPAKVLSSLRIDRPIDQVIAELLATLPHPYGLVFDVMTDQDEWPDGRVPIVGDRAGLIRLRSGGETDTTQKTADSVPTGQTNRVSYWDVVTYYCNLRGAVPYFRGSTLWVRPTPDVLSTDGRRPHPAPFEGDRPRRDGDEEIRVRRLVVGRSVKKITRERKFGGVVAPRVVATSVDDRARGKLALIEESWPPADSAAAKLKGEVEPIRVPVPGVIDRKQLLAVARATYEEVGRGEVTGTVSTGGYLASFAGDDSDPDLLWVRASDAIEILVDGARDALSEMNRHEARTFEEEVEDVTAQLGDPVLARVIVATRRGAIVDQLDIYRVDGVRKEFKSKDGISVEAAFSSYIVARNNAQPADQATGPQNGVTRRRVRTTGHQGPVTLNGQTISLDKTSLKKLEALQADRDRTVARVRKASQSTARDARRALRGVGLTLGEIDDILAPGGGK